MVNAQLFFILALVSKRKKSVCHIVVGKKLNLVFSRYIQLIFDTFCFLCVLSIDTWAFVSFTVFVYQSFKPRFHQVVFIQLAGALALLI